MDIDREAVLPLMVAPATAYRELLYRPGGQLSRWIGERFDILARPGRALTKPPRPGDVLLTVTLGQPGGGECGVLTDANLTRRRFTRSAAPGWYCTVTGATATRRRLILDPFRHVPPGQLLLRQRPATAGEQAEAVTPTLTCPLFADDPELREVFAGRLRLGARGTPNHPAPVRSEGTAVRKVQLALIAAGHNLPSGADGKFGPETGRAVVRFKTARGIMPNDPVVGPKTITALDAACRAKAPPARIGYRIAASGRNTGRTQPGQAPTPPVPLHALSEGEESTCDAKVAVVGGGFAGLMAAWSLQSGKFNVTLFEARGELGGRVRTDRKLIPGKVVEAGAELIGENHPTWILLAKKFKLRLERISTDDDYARQGLRSRIILGGHELTDSEWKGVERELEPVLKLIGSEAKTVPALQPWNAQMAATWDGMSVAERFDKPDMFGQKSTTGRKYLEYKIVNDNCAPVGDHSYLALLAAVSAGRMGNDMLGYWTHTETHRCAGGNDQIVTSLAKDVKDIRLSSLVESITLGSAATRVTYRQRDGQHHEAFDFVILAGPPSTWPRVQSTPEFDPSKFTVAHGNAVKFLSSVKAPFWKKHKLAPALDSDDTGQVWESTDNQKGAKGFGLSVYSGGPFVLDAKTYNARLDQHFKDYLANRIAFKLVDWPHEPHIMAGYAVPLKGQVTTIVKNLNGSFEDRIFFAGEQVSPGFFGYMEGALQSGLQAAGRVAVAACRTKAPVRDPAEAADLFDDRLPVAVGSVGEGEGG